MNGEKGLKMIKNQILFGFCSDLYIIIKGGLTKCPKLDELIPLYEEHNQRVKIPQKVPTKLTQGN